MRPRKFVSNVDNSADVAKERMAQIRHIKPVITFRITPNEANRLKLAQLILTVERASPLCLISSRTCDDLLETSKSNRSICARTFGNRTFKTATSFFIDRARHDDRLKRSSCQCRILGKRAPFLEPS